MIDHSNLEDFEDPLLYDAEEGDFEPDGPFYLALAEKVGSPTLELGCGTGRITIPLSQRGIEITGLDLAPAMLEHARNKARGLPIQWIEADMRHFQLNQRFRLVCATGGSFQLLLTRPDQEMALARVREHLQADGYFAIDVVVPQPSWLRSVEEVQEWDRVTDEQGRQIVESGSEVYDPIAQVKHETIYREWQTQDQQTIKRQVHFAFRHIFPQEMEALLHYNGFTVVARYSDADFGPVTQDSRALFYICQLA